MWLHGIKEDDAEEDQERRRPRRRPRHGSLYVLYELLLVVTMDGTDDKLKTSRVSDRALTLLSSFGDALLGHLHN